MTIQKHMYFMDPEGGLWQVMRDLTRQSREWLQKEHPQAIRLWEISRVFRGDMVRQTSSDHAYEDADGLYFFPWIESQGRSKTQQKLLPVLPIHWERFRDNVRQGENK